MSTASFVIPCPGAVPNCRFVKCSPLSVPKSFQRISLHCSNSQGPPGQDGTGEDVISSEYIPVSPRNEVDEKKYVLAANQAFYDAMRTRSIPSMREAWMSSSDNVSLAHPLQGIISGLDDVMSAWADMFALGTATHIETDVLKIDVKKNAAWCICTQKGTGIIGENIVGGERIATNIFQMHRGRWKMVYHGTSPVIIEDDDGLQRMRGMDDYE